MRTSRRERERELVGMEASHPIMAPACPQPRELSFLLRPSRRGYLLVDRRESCHGYALLIVNAMRFPRLCDPDLPSSRGVGCGLWMASLLLPNTERGREMWNAVSVRCLMKELRGYERSKACSGSLFLCYCISWTTFVRRVHTYVKES